MLNITTDNINFGYRYRQSKTDNEKVTARKALTTKTLKKRNIADTAAALGLYKALLPAGWVWSLACLADHSPSIVNGTATHVKNMLRIRLSINLALGCIANESDDIMATIYP